MMEIMLDENIVRAKVEAVAQSKVRSDFKANNMNKVDSHVFLSLASLQFVTDFKNIA